MSDQNYGKEMSKRYRLGSLVVIFSLMALLYVLLLFPGSPPPGLKEKFEILSYWGQAIAGLSLIFIALAYINSSEAVRMQREQLQAQQEANLQQAKLMERTAIISALAAAMEACVSRLKYVEVNLGTLTPQAAADLARNVNSKQTALNEQLRDVLRELGVNLSGAGAQ